MTLLYLQRLKPQDSCIPVDEKVERIEIVECIDMIGVHKEESGIDRNEVHILILTPIMVNTRPFHHTFLVDV